tara:strand:+ start:1118 stop:1747 length:630 start_codon:yes stop_codon:yes gene_type:complete
MNKINKKQTKKRILKKRVKKRNTNKRTLKKHNTKRNKRTLKNNKRKSNKKKRFVGGSSEQDSETTEAVSKQLEIIDEFISKDLNRFITLCKGVRLEFILTASNDDDVASLRDTYEKLMNLHTRNAEDNNKTNSYTLMAEIYTYLFIRIGNCRKDYAIDKDHISHIFNDIEIKLLKIFISILQLEDVDVDDAGISMLQQRLDEIYKKLLF